MTKARNRRIVYRLLVEPTIRTHKEHSLIVCRTQRGRIVGALQRGHYSIVQLPCPPEGIFSIPPEGIVPIMQLHTHRTPDLWQLSHADRKWARLHHTPVCAITPQPTHPWEAWVDVRIECYDPVHGTECGDWAILDTQ